MEFGVVSDRPVLEGVDGVAAVLDEIYEADQGAVVHSQDQQLTLHRSGQPEPVWMDLDYPPVLDEASRPVGVMRLP